MLLIAGGCADPATSAALGTLERDQIDLVADSNEPIVGILVKEGQIIEAGEILMMLDTTRRRQYR